MRFGPIRRLFMLVVLGAFLCAGFSQPMPATPAAPGASMAGMAMDGGDGAPMPCTSLVPGCYSDIGCIFMIALPPDYLPTAVPLTWSRVTYAVSGSARPGLSFEPDLGPPIQLG